MNLKLLKFFRLYLLFFAIIGWLSVFIIMALYTYELLTFDINTIWGFISVLSLMPVGAALFQYLFFNIVADRIKKNIEEFRNSQKFCYFCGQEITSHKKLITCAECKANLNILDILLK